MGQAIREKGTERELKKSPRMGQATREKGTEGGMATLRTKMVLNVFIRRSSPIRHTLPPSPPHIDHTINLF